MQLTQLDQIRTQFLNFFQHKAHEIVKSSSLIPKNDPTLLFINAGMNQFKDIFLGYQQPTYLRAVSAQKCVRAGGKHNDLENVGFTNRHHTFFEMLGNFSFGDYFKRDALLYAWEFLTSKDYLNIPPEKLYVTVYHTDDEAYQIWHQLIGLAPERIIRIGNKAPNISDNFWQMGDSGPCGPCSEIFYDHGEQIAGGLPGTPEQDGDRYVEIWNCVFMQFNRDQNGALHPLPKPAVDTGMGLERISAVLQKVDSNYKIDLFKNLIDSALKITATADPDAVGLKVIADHIRAIAFLIADGVTPNNEGRGYVLRRITRRAIRYGYQLGMRQAFLYKMINNVSLLMGGAYPELILQQQHIIETLKSEEDNFFQTIVQGMEILQNTINGMSNNILSGKLAFKLYDTYGFPLDLSQDLCREQQIEIDITEFAVEMAKQKTQARNAAKFKINEDFNYEECDSKFDGYLNHTIKANIVAIYQDQTSLSSLQQGEQAIIILDQSVFYAEGGGQVGDIGVISSLDGASALFHVSDTQKIKNSLIAHIGKLTIGTLQVGEEITATIDLHYRLQTTRNHSATHILHRALHQVVGVHALQKGSLVNADYLRFDFAHHQALNLEEITEIERIVNHVIMMNYPVSTKLMNYQDAEKYGALALFGEKYNNQEVRVVEIGEFSRELCGGTHVQYSGTIGSFIIKNELGISSGVRRIQALTGEKALNYNQQNHNNINQLQTILKITDPQSLKDKISTTLSYTKLQQEEINFLKIKIALLESDDFLDQIVKFNDGTKLLIASFKNIDPKNILTLLDHFKNKFEQGIIVLGVCNEELVNLVVRVSTGLTNSYQANVIINKLAPIITARGGGNAHLAQARGLSANFAQLTIEAAMLIEQIAIK